MGFKPYDNGPSTEVSFYSEEELDEVLRKLYNKLGRIQGKITSLQRKKSCKDCNKFRRTLQQKIPMCSPGWFWKSFEVEPDKITTCPYYEEK